MAPAPPPAKFAHLELTFPYGALDAATCADIDGFWCEIFGWTSDDVHYPEYDNLRQHRLHVSGQAIVLAEADEPLVPPVRPVGVGPGMSVAVPHLGLELASFDELERVLAACIEAQKSDDRVKIWDSGEIRFDGGHHLHHAFLVNYILPMWFDVYARKFDEGHEPELEWRYVEADEAKR